jgi:hypothetical protein
MQSDDPEEARKRAIAVGEMLHFIAEGVTDGTWKNFKFTVRQHRSETLRYGRRVRTGPPKVEITFNMDVDEDIFKADTAKRRQEVHEALRLVDGKRVDTLLIEHEGDNNGKNR